MSNFTAIDFETATEDRASICQVGIVLVRRCEIIERIEFLVKPPANRYSQRCIDIHGIKPEDTIDADPFDVVWKKIKPFIIGQNIVAHNAAFDHGCLMKTLKFYGIPLPKLGGLYCTMKIYNCGLDIACAINGIKLKHHNALSDAESAALLMIKDIKR